MNPSVLSLAIGSVFLNAMAQIALRKTMMTLPKLAGGAHALLGLIPALLFNAWFIGGMACYAVSIVVWMLVLGKVEVSLAYPLLSIGYVIAAVIGYFFLGEHVTTYRILGIAIICVGIVVLSRWG